jgi:hypothetical protein
MVALLKENKIRGNRFDISDFFDREIVSATGADSTGGG